MDKEPKIGLPTKKLLNLSDSVFGVAMTILILNITVPVLSMFNQEQLTNELIKLWPKALVYGSSVFVIGVFWIAFQILFTYIQVVNIRLMIMNTILLMGICFIPFAANLISTYPWRLPSSLIYGTTLFVTSAFYLFIWIYALKQKLVVDNLSESFIKKATLIVAGAPLLYLLATLTAFINPRISFFIFIIIPILYILPSPVDDLLPKEE